MRLEPFPRLQAIVDVGTCEAAGWRPADLARAFLEGGARFLQLRAKALSSDAFLHVCDAVVRDAQAYDARVIINDRADLAAMSGAAGVHVGQDDLPPAAVRSLLGPNAIVGYSTHTMRQVECAASEPITYLAIGPVFGTRTKDTGYDAIGLEMVAKASRAVRPVPVVAIGGITLERAEAVIEAGAACVAVISDLLRGSDPARRVRQYVERLGA